MQSAIEQPQHKQGSPLARVPQWLVHIIIIGVLAAAMIYVQNSTAAEATAEATAEAIAASAETAAEAVAEAAADAADELADAEDADEAAVEAAEAVADAADEAVDAAAEAAAAESTVDAAAQSAASAVAAAAASAAGDTEAEAVVAAAAAAAVESAVADAAAEGAATIEEFSFAIEDVYGSWAWLIIAAVFAETIFFGMRRSLSFASTMQISLIIMLTLTFLLMAQQIERDIYNTGVFALIILTLLQIAFGNISPEANFRKSMVGLIIAAAIITAIVGLSIWLAPILIQLGR